MSFCNSACTQDVPQFAGAGCEITPRSSGIRRLIFAKCDITFVDLTDLTEWETKLTANEVHATGEIKASKPSPSFTKKKLASCLPEKVVGGNKTIQFSDANADNANFTDYAFYNHVIANQGNMVFGYFTCDDLFYGWIDNFALEMGDVRTDNSDDEALFEGVITWNGFNMEVPISIPGLNAVLN